MIKYKKMQHKVPNTRKTIKTKFPLQGEIKKHRNELENDEYSSKSAFQLQMRTKYSTFKNKKTIFKVLGNSMNIKLANFCNLNDEIVCNK